MIHFLSAAFFSAVLLGALTLADFLIRRDASLILSVLRDKPRVP